jgi:hypothetical protein
MPAKRIAAMGRSYRYPQADRRNFPPSLLRDSAASKTARPILGAILPGGSFLQYRELHACQSSSSFWRN